MGLTKSSTGIKTARGDFFTYKTDNSEKVLVGLAGNPNVGKSTLFNNLTGMHQHTGNWPGKTVTSAVGILKHNEKEYLLADLPGTYSLLTHSKEEEVARDFICFANSKMTVVVCDATCLERNLNLCLQIIEMSGNVLICVNLLDEAKRKGISIDLEKMSLLLGVPVVGIVASNKKTYDDFLFELENFERAEERVLIKYPSVVEECIKTLERPLAKYDSLPFSLRWLALRLITDKTEITQKIKTHFSLNLLENAELVSALEETEKIIERYGYDVEKINDKIASEFVKKAENIAKQIITENGYSDRDKKIDRLLTGKFTGFPLMIALLCVVFWITVKGANYPSEILSSLFSAGEKYLFEFLKRIMIPEVLCNVLIYGVYRVLTWVVSVMLPPMSIFFPLFTLLEDLGYLPRVAFNLDYSFQKSNSCGKQALTTCMGFGCNAAGVTGCRIIDSDRERLTAILTNCFVPCNGRFPMLITVITAFFVSSSFLPELMPSVILTLLICFSVIMTLFVSKLLSKSCLKGVSSSFSLELPPFRKPQIGKIIIRSVLDRTLFVLGRAVAVAAPAGLIIWLMANIKIGNQSVLNFCTEFFDPFARLFGLDGVILLGFILGFPANEIVIPLTVMGYTSAANIEQISDIPTLKSVFLSNGWTEVTAICFIVFTLMHWPCSTTCITMYKETKSLKWTLIGFALPTFCGLIICFMINSLYRIFMCM